MLETTGTRPLSWYAEQTPNKLFDEEEEEAMNRTFFIAGVKFHQLPRVVKEIEVGDTLSLVPEPDNRFDPNAIRIEYEAKDESVMLGYIPKVFSSEGAAMIEAGIDLECVVETITPGAKPWEMCKVTVRGVVESESDV